MNKGSFERYYQEARLDVAGLVPQEALRLLDVGCAAGQTGKLFKQRGCYVAGVELDERAAGLARMTYDRVIEGDVEKIELDFREKEFDCIICADILEHLREPAKVLARLAPLLADSGCLVLSIPNAGHYSVIWGLLRGRWEYQAEGLLDRTHLRFFTLRSIRTLLSGSGFRIHRMSRKIKEGWKLRLINRLLFNCLRGLITYQYLIVARKA